MVIVHVLRHQQRPIESPQFGTLLTEAGSSAACSDLYADLRGIPVVSSPFLRCLTTANPWRGPQGFVDYGLCEFAPGVDLEVRALTPDEAAGWDVVAGPVSAPDAAETLAAMQVRIQAALRRSLALARDHGFPEIVLCTHQSCATQLCALLGASEEVVLGMGQWWSSDPLSVSPQYTK